MYITDLFNAANGQISVLPLQIAKIDGYFRGASADGWLQVWDSSQAPTASDNLIKQWPISQTSPFYFEFKDNNLLTRYGCFIGVSSTEGTWTASAETMDVSVESENPPFGTTAANVAGALDAANTILVPFTDGNGGAGAGPGTLYRIDVLTGSAIVYVQVFAKGAVNNDIPIFSSLAVPANTLIHLDFGSDGLKPFSRTAAGVASNGCYIYCSSNPTKLVTSLTVYNIQAVYAAN